MIEFNVMLKEQIKNNMKYYIATKLENHEQYNDVMIQLKLLGHEITYDWTEHGPVWMHGINRMETVSRKEIYGVIKANVLIVLWPGGRGTHIELGCALAHNKTVLMVTNEESHWEARKDSCAFYFHSLVKKFRTVEDLISYIKEYYV